MNEQIELVAVRYINKEANTQARQGGGDWKVQLPNGDVENFRYETRRGLHTEMALENAALLETIPEYQIGDRPAIPLSYGTTGTHEDNLEREAELVRQNAQANSSNAGLAAQVAALQAQLAARAITGVSTIKAIRAPLGWKELSAAKLDAEGDLEIRTLAAANQLTDEGPIIAVYKALGDFAKNDDDTYEALEQVIEDSEFRKALAEEASPLNAAGIGNELINPVGDPVLLENTATAIAELSADKEAKQAMAATNVPEKRSAGRPAKAK